MGKVINFHAKWRAVQVILELGGGIAKKGAQKKNLWGGRIKSWLPLRKKI